MSMHSQIFSEEQILACIHQYFPNKTKNGYIEKSDDCALLNIQKSLCISTDMFIENVHFRHRYFTPEDIGWKALSVNISDLAACGAQPVGFSVGLALPPDTSIHFIEKLCAGMAMLSNQFNLPLLGGDLSQAAHLYLCITVLGETSTPLLRKKAEIGDVIFILGQVGLARAGLHALEKQGRTALQNFPTACEAHLRPFPLIKEGLILSQIVTNWSQQTDKPHRLSLMDISDGLAQDLPRLLGKEKGADIRLPQLHPELIQFVEQKNIFPDINCSPELYAFLGGEDYGLVGTCTPQFASMLQCIIPELTILGYVTNSNHVLCNGVHIQGFDHFSNESIITK